MKVLLNFIKGFKSTGKAAKMVVLLFIINLAFSLVLAVPMYHSLKSSMGKSKAGERMAKGFDYLWWEEFQDDSKGLSTTFTPSIIGPGALLDNVENLVHMRKLRLPPVILIAGLLYIILHTFLAGGILSLFIQRPIKFTMKSFFEGAGHYFIRFFLLMLISWVFFMAISIFLNSGFSSIIDNVSRKALTEKEPFFLGLFFSALIFFLILFIQMVFDYARINIVVEDGKNVFKSALKAFSFVFRHPGSTLGLYYLIFLISLAVAGIYILIKSIIPQSAFIGVFTAFLFQQTFIFAVIWLRCWLYSSQLELYRYLE